MDTREIEQYIIDFQKKEFPVLFNRKIDIPTTPKIKAIIGPRRAGKTFFLYQIMENLLKKGAKKEELLFLNFESTRLSETNFKNMGEIVGISEKIFPSEKKKILFIDEPQIIENWEKAVRELYDEGFNIFISGSSSKLLSKEIATSLRGRSLSYLVLPLSFLEFLNLRGFEASKIISSSEKNKMLSLFNEYIAYGGFPEVVLEKDKDTKMKILENYLELVVYKDLVERYKIRDSFIIKWLIKSISSCYSKELSINKTYLTLKSQGRQISKDDLYNYASLISDSFFIFYLPKFSWSVRKNSILNKAYLCDVGYANFIELDKDRGKRLENLVFLELWKKKKPLAEVSYYKDSQGYEADFVIQEGTKVKQIIQACYDIKNLETKEREIRALLKASKELNCKELLVITEDYEAEEEAEWFGLKGKIKFIPFWKWVLD